MRGVELAVLAVVSGGCDVIFGLRDVKERDAAPPVGAFTAVATGNSLTCAIDLDGGLWCWGYNGDGALGLNVQTNELDVPTHVSGGPWSAIAVGTSHGCGIHGDGTLWCWGSNFSGQLGNPGAPNQRAPQQVGIATWKAVGARGDHTCAIDTGEQLWCWGTNVNGQVGVGDTMNRDTPTLVTTGAPIASVALGRSHTCALTHDGIVECWGANFSGQLGVVNIASSTTPVAVAGTWSALASGDDFSCAIDDNGGVQCWGDNSLDELGDGGDTDSATPHAIDSMATDFTTVAAGSTQACAIHHDGSLECWGDATPGLIAMPSSTPVAVSGGASKWTAMAMGRTHSCGLGAFHDLYCIGDDSSGALGDGMSSTSPLKVIGTATILDIGAGGAATCALDATGTLTCWGANSQSQLGDGTTTRRFTPTPVASATTWSEISVGLTHACAVAKTGQHVSCWGFRGLGNAASIVTTPTPISTPTALTHVTAGADHSCGIGSAGAECWGSNISGELGNNSSSPDQVTTPGLTMPSTLTAIADGAAFTCAVMMGAGVLACAGANDHGQLATSGGASSKVFAPLLSSSGWGSVAAGYEHACAIQALGTNGSCWGSNNFGQVRAPPSDSVPAPTPIDGTWKSLAPGKYHTCGVSEDRSVWCWGRDDFGQLGDGLRVDGPMTRVSLPVGTLGSKVVSGDNHSCVMTTTGDVWCWGNNHDGELGSTTGWTYDFTAVPDPR